MKLKETYRVVSRRAPSGGYDWRVERYDKAVAHVLGEKQGWAPIHRLFGNVTFRSDALPAARAALDEYLYREANPDEVEEVFEIEREL